LTLTKRSALAVIHDDDEDNAKLRFRFRNPINGDVTLIAGGLGLAAFAAFFPWYVFFNQEQFGVRPMVYSQSRDLPALTGRNIVSVSPLAIVNSDPDSSPLDNFDPLFTATVPGEDAPAAERSSSQDALNQPFPRAVDFRLLHVANGRALIEDPEGVYIVRIGSVLPDNSRLSALERRDGKWAIVTSDGKVINE
jgi:hypothetical protein